MGERTCSIEDCDRPHYGRGWCRLHWRQLRELPSCSINDCEKRGEKRGWCAAHYRNWRTYGDPLGTAQRPTVCSIDQCNGKPYGHGWCSRHWGSWSTHGDPQATDRKRQAREAARNAECAVEDCTTISHCRGWCVKHYAKWVRHGSPVADLRDAKNRYEVASDGVHILTMISDDGREHPVLFDAVDCEVVRSRRWHLSGQGYATTFTLRSDGEASRRSLRMHRVVMGLSWGDAMHVDHRNGNRLDNRRENLRLATPLLNGANREIVNGVGSSRFRGVSWDKQRQAWVAYVKVNYRKHHLGKFSTEEAAADAVARFREQSGLPTGY